MEGLAQHNLIVKEALERGFGCIDRSDDQNAIHDITINSHTEELINGVPKSWLPDDSQKICDEKDLTKELFSALKIPSPKSYVFNTLEDLNSEALESGRTFVVKPVVGTNGIGVDLSIETRADLESYLEKGFSGPFILEEFVTGKDLRIQVIGGKLVAACIRKPAFIIGDGQLSTDQLITLRKAEIKSQNAANRLDLNEETFELLKQQNLKLDAVPAKGQEVQLKRIANIGQGGVAYDVTNEIDTRLHNWIDGLVSRLNTGYFALDLIASDHTDFNTYRAIEINIRAEWMHHTFSENRTHDLAKVVVDELSK